MKVWTFAGMIMVLAATVCRGQYILQGMPEGGGPPMVDAPMPTPPFAPPPPTPLPPEQAVPMVPALPSPFPGPLEPSVPIVRLRVHAPARVEPEKEIEYRLTVQNVSSADAHHVQVRDRLPRGVDKYVRAKPEPTRKPEGKDKDVTDLLWELGTLKAGERKEILLTIKPKGTKDIENRAYVQFEHGQKVTTRIAKAGEMPALQSTGISSPKPSVRVQVIAPAQAILYQSIPVRIEVTNTGAVSLRNVVVTEKLPDGLQLGAAVKPQPTNEKPLTWKIGDLAPYQTHRIECEVISTKGGKFTTQVRATAEDGVTSTASAAVTVGETNLKISTSGPQRRLATRPIPYHITVRNLGTIPVTDVQVTDELPRDIEFVKASPGGRKEGGFVRWSLGTLPPGERRSLLLVVRAPKPGWCLNQATVKADNNLSDKAHSDWTRIDFADSPVVEIDKNTESLDVGQKAVYTIRLVNPKKQAELRPSVVITVPDEMTIQGQRGPTVGQQEGQLVRFEALQVLAPGEEKEYVVEVEARKPGEARLLARWTDGRQEPDPPKNWEDKTIIFDSTRPGSGVASAPRKPSSER